jgi:hypothetical protein
MHGAVQDLSSPAGVLGVCAAMLWAPAVGNPTWPALARGRWGVTLAISIAVGVAAFTMAWRLAAPVGG